MPIYDFQIFEKSIDFDKLILKYQVDYEAVIKSTTHVIDLCYRIISLILIDVWSKHINHFILE